MENKKAKTEQNIEQNIEKYTKSGQKKQPLFFSTVERKERERERKISDKKKDSPAGRPARAECPSGARSGP
jgi:hypothetical protein